MSMITVKELTKTYKVPTKKPGLGASVRSLFRPEFEERLAVRHLNFEIGVGELVGVLGPNGAGKTTTMKMLSGILQPTSGSCEVLGYTPGERNRAFQQRIAMIMGMKNGLWWDLPAADSFALQKEIYGIRDEVYRKDLDLMADLLNVRHLLSTPVRNLSLGERMKMELIAGLLHRPDVLFLDEPTIGLDITAQRAIREFVRTINQERGVTVLLTSHYMQDIQELCKRVIIINRGVIVYDGSLTRVSEQFSDLKTVVVSFLEPVPDEMLQRLGTVLEREPLRATLQVKRKDAPQVVAALSTLPMADVNIQEFPIERAIEHMFVQEIV